MPHLDEGTLHALLDGEVPSTEMAAVQAHLLGCADCRTRLEEARSFREESLGMLAALDEEPVEPVSLHELAMAAGPLYSVAARTAEETPMPFGAPAPKVRVTEPRPEPRKRIVPAWATSVAWAATIVLAVGIGYRMSGPTADQPVLPADERATANAEPAPGPASAGDSGAPLASVAPPAAPTPKTQPAPPPVAGAAGRSRTQAFEKKTTAEERPREAAEEPPRATDRSDAQPAKPAPPAANPATEQARPSAAPAPRRALRRNETVALDELVVTGATDASVRRLDADSAIRALGGSIRLIDGLTPTRYTQVGDTVRVEYPTTFGPMILEQWRADNVLRHRLRAPSSAPGDSISAWEERIR